MLAILKTIHFLAFTAGVGGGMAGMISALMARRAEPAGQAALRRFQRRISQVSAISLLVLWVTGIWLVVSFYDVAAMPLLFWVKMLAVVGLTLAAGRAQFLSLRAMRGGEPPEPRTMMRLSLTGNGCALAALVLAVFAFS